MPIEITEYRSEHESLVKAFNTRLQGHYGAFSFPERCVPGWLPRKNDAGVFREFHVAVENNVDVRGAFCLRHQPFRTELGLRNVVNYQGIVSEGITDKRYALVGPRTILHALKMHPFMYVLGMGGNTRPLPRLLRSLGWSMVLVPFQFKILNGRAFFKNITFLRKSALRRIFFDVVANIGIGSLTALVLNLSGEKKSASASNTAREEDRFGSWADDVWNSAMESYKLIALRDRATMDVLYPEGDRKNIVLHVVNNDTETIGWAVVRCTQLRNHKQFGNMRLGSIVDCLSLPDEEFNTIDPVWRYLYNRDVDLVVSNQANSRWCEALARCGFLRGPSNFALSLSPELEELVGPVAETMKRMHFNRSDGDGPVHL
jgi:hypothetical protein